MSQIEELVKEIDTLSEDLTEIRVFTLLYADATETAQIITDVFSDKSQSSSSRNQMTRFGGGRFGGFRGGGPGGPMGMGGSQNQQNSRTVQENTIMAVADTRTNSVIVRAAGEIMQQIMMMVARIDAIRAKEQKVFVHSINSADSDQLLTILEGMFGSQTGTGRRTTQGTSSQNQYNRSNTSNRNSNRNTQGRSGGGSSFGGGGGGGGSSFGGGGGSSFGGGR
jgi:type II secretory pathway component GspD/PulD (secretin)